VSFALKKNMPPGAVCENPELLRVFQEEIRSQGIETQWPD